MVIVLNVNSQAQTGRNGKAVTLPKSGIVLLEKRY
jgi:hypothetical protein